MSTLQAIECSVQPLDVSFHPQRPTLLAAALVDGTLEVHDFEPIVRSKKDQNAVVKSMSDDNDDDEDDDDDDTILASISIHTQLIPCKKGRNTADENAIVKKASCRAVRFSHDGQRLVTGGSAGDICGLDAERACSFQGDKSSIVWRINAATYHKSPVQVLHQLPSESVVGPLFCTGDESGGVRLWDDRICLKGSGETTTTTTMSSLNNKVNFKPPGCVFSWKLNSDYISAFDHSKDGNTLLASSADGCLSVFDLRKATSSIQIEREQQAARKSDCQDDELLTVQTMKHGRKVVCGTQEGVLNIWSWGRWGDISDRFPGAHPSSVDALLKVDEDTLLTGSSDGLLRVIQIQPDKLWGSLGDHDGFPIEKLQFNANRTFVGSISHDPYIRLFDASVLTDDDDDDGDGKEDGKVGMVLEGRQKPPANLKPIAASSNQASDDDWEDMDADSDDMDEEDNGDGDNSMDSDSDSDNNNRKKGGSGKLKTANENFFADL